ncbi:MAG: DUF1329 domain-containing protein [Desulfobacterales bacterium]
MIQKIGKFILVLSIIMLITPYFTIAKEVNFGDVVNSENVEEYEEYFPPFVVRFIKDGFGLVEPTTPIHVEDLEIPLPPKSFREASEKNKGKVTLNPENFELAGFEYCGYPFPDVKEPNKIEKIMANYYYRWRTDDYYFREPHLTASTQQRRGGRITKSYSKSALVRYIGRTAPGFKKNLNNPNELYWAQMNRFFQPAYRNLQTLQWRYIDPVKDDDMWSYIPTLRRTLRMVSSERANPINGSPLTYDDFMGFDGKLQQFTYNLVAEKKVIGNINYDEDLHYEKYPEGYYPYPVFHGPDYPYGLVDVYEIEVIPRDPKYPESKKVLFMNKHNYWNVYTEVYDKRGEQWKGLICNVSKVKTEKGEYGPYNSQMDFDLKTGHWLQIITNKLVIDSGFPTELFDPAIFQTWP